jgi:hypothetical protein
MSKKKKIIKYKKERVVLSDILPYEIPISFSNRHFYNFLVRNKIELIDHHLFWKKDDDQLVKILEILFNIDIDLNDNEKYAEYIKSIGNTSYTMCKYKIDNKLQPYKHKILETIPFNFKISHKNNDYRELTIIHPVNQLAIIDFYNKYKYLIIYYSNISPYSIRKPYKIAKYTFFKDKKHFQKKSDEPNDEIIEEFGKEYENLKTFFVYDKYSNIYKFYESYIYHRNEKKFEELHKFDISKCFDSIYTHSISWALQNKSIVKKYICLNSYTFSGAFDTLMQKLNYNETNGIVIGPEFSRIFAELILQNIDFKVYKELENIKIRHKIDYAIFRYVDDYFLFYNNEETKQIIIDLYIHELKKYKLYISDNKSTTYKKPIITELSIAKYRVSTLLNELIKFNEEKEEATKTKKYSFNINAKSGIINFKTIVKETGIEYKDILNYTFSIIDNKLYKILKKYDKADFNNDENLKNKFKDTFIKSIVELLDFIMFLYAVSPRVNTTIKVSSILSKLIKFIINKKEKEKKYFNKDQRDTVFKKIFDELSFILSKNKLKKYTRIETLYLLIILQNLGSNYRLDQQILFDYFNIIDDNGKKKFKYQMDFWSLTVLLFYIRDLKRYNDLREILKSHILEKLKSFDEIKKNSEAVFLIFDILACPYLNNSTTINVKDKKDKYEFKIKIINLISNYKNLKNEDKIKLIKKIENNAPWFTKWNNFDIERELNTKKSKEVY